MGTDFAASLSASDSTTQGVQQDFRDLYGDVFFAKKPLPPWVWLTAAGLVGATVIVWLVRR